MGKPKIGIGYYTEEYSNIYHKCLMIISSQQAKSCFWSVRLVITSMGRTMLKQKTVQDHA